MTEEQASEKYWKAVFLLREVVESEQRGSKEELFEELEDDLERF